MKKPILVLLFLSISEAVEAGSSNCLLVQHVSLLTTLLEKKYFQQSRVHLILINFSV